MKNLNSIRKEKKMSVEELARLANLPRSTVEKVLFGIVKNPRVSTMEAIERALEVAEPSKSNVISSTSLKKPLTEFQLTLLAVVDSLSISDQYQVLGFAQGLAK